MKLKWENVGGDLDRLWVPKGWLVRDSHMIFGSVLCWMKTMTFVFDPLHEWEIE